MNKLVYNNEGEICWKLDRMLYRLEFITFEEFGVFDLHARIWEDWDEE